MKKLAIITLLTIIAIFGINNNAFAISADTETALLYLGQPQFSGGNFLKQLTGCDIVKLEMVDFQDKAVYFSVDANDYTKSEIGKLCNSFKKVEFGKTEYSSKLKIEEYNDGALLLSEYRYKTYGRYFFRVLFNNIKFNNRITYYFGKGIYYDITLSELKSFGDGLNSYEADSVAAITKIQYSHGEQLVGTMISHGPWVSKKESSLTRLAKRITRDCRSIQDKIQALNDFVSNEISYSFSEANASVETMKEANEILMSGEADCSGKATLLASLLEQIDVKNIIVYMDGHVTIGVRWPVSLTFNRLWINWKGENYTLAEGTAPGFQVGRSIPTNDGRAISSKDIRYIQVPGQDIYRYPSMEKLEYFYR